MIHHAHIPQYIRRPHFWAAILCGFVFGSMPVFLFSQPGGQVLTLITEASAVQFIGRDVQYLHDPSHQLGVQEISQGNHAGRFHTFTARNPNLGYVRDAVWLRIHIKNMLPVVVERVLDVGSVLMDSVALYEPDVHGNFREYWAGNNIFIAQRAMKIHRASFTLRLNALEEKIYYVRAVGEMPLTFHLVLYPSNEFTQSERSESGFYGCIWGIIICIVALNLTLFATTRSVIYGYFALHCMASMLALLSVCGILTEYIWFNVEGFGGRILQISISLSNLLSVRYAQIFLASHRRPLMHSIFNSELIVSLLLIAFAVAGIGSFMVASLFTLIVVPTIVVLTLRTMQEYKGAMRTSYLLYALAWAFCTTTVIASNILGVVTDVSEVWGVKTGAIGAAIQLFVVSIALAVRAGDAQRELARAQQAQLFAEEEREREYLRNKELSAANDSVRRQTEQLEEQAQSLRTANTEMEQIAQELIQQRTLLQQKNEALNSANTEKSEILSIAAHDLKNPLTGLKGMLEILRSGDDFKPAYLHRMSSTMQQSVDRMFDIIKNLLDLQALDEGAIKPEIEVFDMVSATKTIVDSYRLSAAHKRISLELKANVSEVPCLADRKLFLQIVDNLLSNAIKYSPPQKRVLVRTVSVQHSPTLGAEIAEFGIINTSAFQHFEINTPIALLIVHDEGPGLTEDDQKRLFQKFARLSAQPTGGEHSTGLGLSISKRLTESMNGAIWCESTSQEGARFVVAFGMPIV